MFTVLEIIKKTTEFFAAKGIESPRLNAELLIGHALARKRMQLYMEFERPLSEAELERIRPLVRRRAHHEPVQYIIGETDFFGLKLKVDSRALIPRPETEQLIEHIVAAVAPAAPFARGATVASGGAQKNASAGASYVPAPTAATGGSEADVGNVRATPLTRHDGGEGRHASAQRAIVAAGLGEALATPDPADPAQTVAPAAVPTESSESSTAVAEAPVATGPARILDLGTGTGAIALALAKTFPAARVIGVDRSAAALALARDNAASTGLAERVTWLQSDWFSAVPGETFDVIAANPPYLTAAETAETALEVRGFEPAEALIAAEDGLADLKRIIEDAPRFLRVGGVLALETGIAHHARLLAQLTAAGFSQVESKRDLTGRDRFVIAIR